MPDAFDAANIPPEFAQTSQLAEDQLNKLQNSDQRVLGSESSTLNLLTSGLTSQAKVLNTIIDKLDAFELRPDQELGTTCQDAFDRHITLTRKLQKSAIQTSLKDQGLLPDTANIQLICPLYVEDGGATNTVPETAIKNLHSFTGEGTTSDIDLKCEHFIDTATDIAVSNRLTHAGCKNLILRKLSGYANLVLQTYLDNQGMTNTTLSLTQLLGFLEKTFRAQSTPEIALHRLQNLPEIRNKNYLQPTGVIARLAKLSCRNEMEEATRKLLFQTRAREYLLKSLQQDDRSLIQKEDQRRLTENKEPLTFIQISEYLTKFHQLKTKPEESFEVHRVHKVEELTEEDDPNEEIEEDNHVNYIANRFRNNNYTPRNSRGLYRSSPRGAGRANFRGAKTPFSRPNTFSPNFRSINKRQYANKNRGVPFQSRGIGFPRRGFQSGFKSNTYQNRLPPRPFGRGRGINTNNYRGANFRGATNRGTAFRGNVGHIKGKTSANRTQVSKASPITAQMLNVEPSQCLLCGSRKHKYNHTANQAHNQCIYWPQQLQNKPCTNHNPPRYGHLRETCMGDFTAHNIQEHDTDSNF